MKKFYMILTMVSALSIATTHPAECPAEEIETPKSVIVNAMLSDVLNIEKAFYIFRYSELQRSLSSAELKNIESKIMDFRAFWRFSINACAKKEFHDEQFIKSQGYENSDFHNALTALCVALGKHVEEITDGNKDIISKLFTISFYPNSASIIDHDVMKKFTHFQHYPDNINSTVSWSRSMTNAATAGLARLLNPSAAKTAPSIRFTPAHINSEDVYEEGTLEIIKKSI